MAPFTILLISHWSRVISEILLHYHNSQPSSLPKWYDTWNSGQNWGCYEQNIALKLQRPKNAKKNFRGLLGALNLKIYLGKRYFWVILDRHYLFLMAKSKSKKLVWHLLFFYPNLVAFWISEIWLLTPPFPHKLENSTLFSHFFVPFPYAIWPTVVKVYIHFWLHFMIKRIKFFLMNIGRKYRGHFEAHGWEYKWG